ncbi:high mobility group [Kickxella alabastrina]|uniref:High mobility group n=1 Tax=Kickxella alabastrina TaxID=61397 RepID=A0ACC1I8G6_9FUNG|nr:high mobility group [Kickxella alabastrina]
MERLCAEHSINEDILRQKSSGGLHCLSKLLCHSLPYTNGDSNAMTAMPKFNPHMHLKFTTEPPQNYPTPPGKHTQEQEQKIKHEHQQAPVKKCHSSVKSARQKPAASATKRPLSDFNFFCRDARKLVVEAHPEYTKEQVNKELGRIWSILDHSSRQYYRGMYAQDKQRYSQDIATIADTELKKSPSSDKYSSFGDMPSSTVATSDVRELPQSTPMQTSLANSVSGLVTPRPVYQNQNNIMYGSAQHHNKLPQFVSSRSTYSSNTIKSILNESFDSACLDGAGDSDDIDEPLVHSLLRNSTHAAHMVKEHRMRETIGVSHTLAGAARQAAPTSDQLACADIALQVVAMISTPQESSASSADSLSDADSGI